jgi:serine/threonine-protein kinase
MEHLDGGSLADRLEQGRPPVEDVLRWLQQAADALDAAHAEGIVHRDVKPANLLLDSEGNVHVADFGVAGGLGLESLTMTGMILGTAGYLSPEQARGERATPASDRYALAVVAYELLRGKRLAAGERVDEPVFRRALADDPAARYPTCGAFVADLRAALAGRTAATLPLAPVQARPRRRPRAGTLLGIGALVVAAGTGASGALLLGRGHHEDAPPAPRPTLTHVVTQTQVTTVSRTIVEQAPPPEPSPPAKAHGHKGKGKKKGKD